MFKVRHATLIAFSGLIWFAIGCLLLSLGLNFIVATLLRENYSMFHPLLDFMGSYAGGADQAALVLIVMALLVGFLKGRTVLSKSVQRNVNRIKTLPNPVNVMKIYPLSGYLLIGSMILIGMLVRLVPLDIRGAIDVAIGSALINGAMLYFRQAFYLRAKVS